LNPERRNKVEKIFSGRWVKVKVNAPTYAFPYVCTGYVYCLEGRRLLDHLNDLFMPKREFLSVREAEMASLRGESEAVQFVCLSKANTLFVSENEVTPARGLGGKLGPKVYPYTHKVATPVKLHLTFYVLTGNMHCVQGERVSDVLNLPMRFLPLTEVRIRPSLGSESGASFVAVNKQQIILLEELER